MARSEGEDGEHIGESICLLPREREQEREIERVFFSFFIKKIFFNFLFSQ